MREAQNARVNYAATHSAIDVLETYGTSLTGLGEYVVDKNRDKYGSNVVTRGEKKSLFAQLVASFISPFTVILLVLAAVSCVTDIIFPRLELFGNDKSDFDPVTMTVILVLVIISGTLHFVQDARSGNAADKLLEMITTTCTVTRKGAPKQEILLDDVVVGDIIHLSAGDMIPADLRILDAKDLFVNQASLTGESEPCEKVATVEKSEKPVTEYANIGFMGANVVSGSATGVVIATGDRTLFGSMTVSVTEEPVETSFTRGVNAVSWLLIRFMLIMVPIVFIINGFTLVYSTNPWLDAFLYAITIAVGLTPEMLPMIVTTCLAKGAVSMSKRKTIVKNLNSIQNFGAIDILCSDKTGTLTRDEVVLEFHMNAQGHEDNRILRHAYLNSYFQTGYKNVMDMAIIRKTEEEEAENPELTDLSEQYIKVDEIPFDFTRRRLTTVVQDRNGKTQMVTKGAVEEMLAVCSYVEIEGEVTPLTDEQKQDVLERINALNEKGFRVLVVAQKSNPAPVTVFGVQDECDMVMIGYLAFLDPPKETTAKAIRALKKYGVQTKILTGDNEKVTRTVCKEVGLRVRNMLTGPEVEAMSDDELAVAVEETDVFAKLTPDQKARIVTILREVNGHAVGYMGDGINDAAAMRCSDIGISVDNAVDIAKESADIILLEKDLTVLENGIIEGRKTYANMIKYIKMTVSANFGNMFSVLVASALIPFLPMTSIHLILLNLIYDISCIAIPWDNVDEEILCAPKNWDASSIGNFMIWFGPVSSIFDWTTYLVLYFIYCPLLMNQMYPEVGMCTYNNLQNFLTGDTLEEAHHAYEGLFQAAWFVESMWSQTLVIHMIRTPKLPFIQSRASAPLTTVTCLAIILLTLIPYTPLGTVLGFVAMPWTYFLYMIPCIILYMVLATCVKRAYIRHYGELL